MIAIASSMHRCNGMNVSGNRGDNNQAGCSSVDTFEKVGISCLLEPVSLRYGYLHNAVRWRVTVTVKEE